MVLVLVFRLQVPELGLVYLLLVMELGFVLVLHLVLVLHYYILDKILILSQYSHFRYGIFEHNFHRKPTNMLLWLMT